MTVDELLAGILTSLDQTKASVQAAETTFVTEKDLLVPQMVQDLLAKSTGLLEAMSLLSLKGNSMLAYVNNLVLVVLAHLERLLSEEEAEKCKEKAVLGTVSQRVTMEKGIKPLEKKLAYQLDKMVRSFHRMEEENAKMEEKVSERAEQKGDESSEEESEEEEEEDSEEEDDMLAYKPDAAALAKMSKFKTGKDGKPRDSEETNGKYKPPKISALAPPSAKFDDRAGPKQSNRKLQSMEEYLAEASDLPQAESSIGATIVDHGRGGVKTSKDKKREVEIQRYEESNFTRLPSTATKKTFKQKMAERANTFAGEDWSMFSNKRKLKEGTSRKRKAGSAWDRVKRRQT